MKFIFFTAYLWILALFHIWEHRRFEADLRDYAAGKTDGDWRVCARSDSAVMLRRAFMIKTRNDVVRYAAPVVFLLVWLLLFHMWWLAFAYIAIMACKWFLGETWLENGGRRYRFRLFNRDIFRGQLD